MKDTFYVKLYGAPGAGKSTGAAFILAYLKMNGVDAEYVQEYAKDMVWEDSKFMFEDHDNQLIIMASQFHRLNRLNGKVDVVVTDSPLMLSQLYAKDCILDCDEYRSLVNKLDHKFKGVSIFINRAGKYNPAGRNESENESNRISEELKKIFEDSNEEMFTVDGDYEGYKKAYDYVMEKLGRGLTY